MGERLRYVIAGGVLAVLGALAAETAAAQMPGQPVLQNAWVNPGITLAANAGIANEANGYAAALSWAPGGARFGLAAGLGAYVPDGGSTTTAFGARLAVPIPVLRRDGSFGVAAFAGGGAARDGDTRLVRLPAGIALGWRKALGETRGISAYATPFYAWSRATVGDVSVSDGAVRVSAGLDFAVTRSIGVSAGYETGQKSVDGNPGPAGDVFGVGVSYLLRRR